MKEELFELKLQGYCCSQMVMEMGLRALGKQNEDRDGRIQSTTRHVEPCGKSGGPPPKAKYSLVTDRAEYCEGKVKRTPGGE